jgi:hypothetical protein
MALRKCKECAQEISTSAKSCPKCGAPVKQGIGIVKAVLYGFAGLVVFSMCSRAITGGGSSGTKVSAEASMAGVAAPANPEQPPPEPPMAVSPVDLWNAYDANEVAADEVYKGRPLSVKGTVETIDKDFLNNIIVRLKVPGQFLGIHCDLEDSEKSKAMSLQKGQAITLQCTGGGRVVGSPVLRKCTF